VELITNKIKPSCNEKEYGFIIDNLPPHLMVPEMILSRLEAHLLKLVIPFIRKAQAPGNGEFKIKGPMISVEAYVKKHLMRKYYRNNKSIFQGTKKKI